MVCLMVKKYGTYSIEVTQYGHVYVSGHSLRVSDKEYRLWRKALTSFWHNVMHLSVQCLLLQVAMCSCIVLQLQCVEKDKSGRFVLHCLQLRPNMVCKTLECHKIVNISSQSEVVQGFPVRVRILTILAFVYLTRYVCLWIDSVSRITFPFNIHWIPWVVWFTNG